MDESYEQLLISEKKRKDKSLPLNAGRIGLRVFHKALVCVIAALFKVRALVDGLTASLRQVILAPFDLILCLAFRLWAKNHSAATSTHLDLCAVRGAFWNGDSIVVSTGMRTFFIKKTCVDPSSPESRCVVPSTQDPKEPPKSMIDIALKPQKQQQQKRQSCRNKRWRFRKRNVTTTISALSPATPATAETIEQTIKRKNVLRERKARIRKALKRSER